MLRGSSRSRNFFRKLVVNGVSNSKTAIRNDCLMRLYDADAELKAISSELDSFDGKKDPIRCNILVNQLRTAQDKVISLLFQLMDDCNCERASRDYRMKFPDEILLSEGSESLNGQIWFGAECLSAGSNILNHTKESTMLRPMAKTLTTHLDSLRNDLRDLVIDGGGASRINMALIKKMVAFDHIFATFEYEYVRTMLPIRTVVEIEKLQEVAVLFSETLIDCVKRGLIKQDDIDEFQPIVMIAVPRLAIVRGLLYKNENPIYTRHKSQMCSLFQPFHGPLHSIKKLLRGLSPQELYSLEKILANDQSANDTPTVSPRQKHREQLQKNSPKSNDDNDNTRQETSIDKSTNDETNNEYSCGCEADENAEASTSHNYSNVLMDGLHYPVGHKRVVQSSSPDHCPQADAKNVDKQNDCCAQASSSKSIADAQQRSVNNESPVCSSPSPSSSLSSSMNCKGCVDKPAENKTVSSSCSNEKPDCNADCCLSPPDSDSQLEKLIAEFAPTSIDTESDTTKQEVVVSNLSTSTPTSSPSSSGLRVSETAAITAAEQKVKQQQTGWSEEEALLEELFQKQAQQLLHRLFVAISGVADQLQSNFASDLRFILRHIFSSEIEGSDEDEQDAIEADSEDEEEVDSDNMNQDHSDGSLAIEQGIEAHEVANLIDLNGDRYDSEEYGGNPHHFAESADPNIDYNYHIHNTRQQASDATHSDLTSSLYHDEAIQRQLSPYPDHGLTMGPNANNRSYRQDQPLNPNVDPSSLTDLMQSIQEDHQRILDSTRSPNEESIMDDARHRRQIVQQHLQQSVQPQVQSMNQPSNRAHFTRPSRFERQILYQYDQREQERLQQLLNQTAPAVQHNGSGERRSRHHGSRSRRPRGPPVWVPDQLVVACSCCNSSFTLFRRRHHCRGCGQIFCADCSKFTKNLNCWGYTGPQRVCESCFNQNQS